MANFSLGEAVLGTGIDLSGLSQGLAKAESGAREAVGRVGGFFSNALGSALGFIGANVLGAAAGAIGNFAAESFQGALEAQAGLDALSGSIDRLGERAPVTMDEALGLADSLKNLVGGSDDVVLAMTNVGLRFDKINKDLFPRFIEQSADLATTLKMEPAKAAEFLGKTLQDMATDGTFSAGRLKAAGLTISEAAEEQIAKMVEAGDTAGAMNLVMDELAKTTGGAAATMAGSAAGQWTIFKEQMADAGEGVMLSLLPALTTLMATVLPQLTPLIGSIAAEASGWITGTLVPAFMTAVAWVQANWPAIQATVAAVWAQMQPALQAAGDFVLTVLVPALQQAVQWVITNWPQIQATIATVMGQIQAVIATVTAVVQTLWAEHGDKVIAVLNFFTGQFKTIFAAFQAAFSGDWRKFGELLREAWDNAWKAVSKIVADAIDALKKIDWLKLGQDIVIGIANGIIAGAGWVKQALTDAVNNAMEAAKGFLGIESPSAVAAAEIGRPWAQGVAGGILAGMPDIRGAAAEAAASSLVDNRQYNIDAHGATVTRADIYTIVRQVMDEEARRGDMRGRLGLSAA